MNDILFTCFYGDDYHVAGADIADEKIVISIESIKTKEKCPCCGAESGSRHGSYTRIIQEAKRNLYGRALLAFLFMKCKLAFASNDPTFDLMELLMRII
jgi:hypothetical protein